MAVHTLSCNGTEEDHGSGGLGLWRPLHGEKKAGPAGQVCENRKKNSGVSLFPPVPHACIIARLIDYVYRQWLFFANLG